MMPARNPGLDAANAAALAIGGKVAVPDFGSSKPEGASDFNDVHQLKGLEAVRKAVEAAQAPAPVSEAQPAPENRSGAILAGRNAQDWPEPMADECMQGLAGDIVRAIEPHTESDPAAILVQTLAAFGALVGPNGIGAHRADTPHIRVEGDRHHTNLFALLVGRSSKARKGTSWGRVRGLFSAVAGWPRVVEGLSTGEGLKYHVRDPLRKLEKDKSGAVTEVEVDGGVQDKRLLAVESEFAQLLRQCSRAGNTLSATIRSAWDSGNLQTLTRNDPITATGAHVCIIGHITADELRAELTATDAANGFANRFLFVAVERSKRLPFGGEALRADVFADLAARIEKAASVARSRSEMRLTQAARMAWSDIYAELSEGHPGLLGAVTGRAEAQVLRLALVYALMDEAAAVDTRHLEAALAVWERCEASARFVFGSAIGDRVADTIFRALRTAADSSMTRTDISKLFSGNETAERIGAALQLLQTRGLAQSSTKADGRDGRPAELWRAL